MWEHDDYYDGYEAGMQRALDIVCGNWDVIKPDLEYDHSDAMYSKVVELVARIVTDIQATGAPHDKR
jgi:hypothetical protein